MILAIFMDGSFIFVLSSTKTAIFMDESGGRKV